MIIIAVGVCGFVLGMVVTFGLKVFQVRTAKELAEELSREGEARRKEEIAALMENLKANFGNISLDALSKSSQEFLRLAREHLRSQTEAGSRDLEAKKELIGQQLKQMGRELEDISSLMRELEKDRESKFGQLASRLDASNQQTETLARITDKLHKALGSSSARGQWGERMAEDVLRLAGFIENVNYLKQRAMSDGRRRPDFTFLLPHDLKLNMDVKFPLDNYVRFLEASSPAEKAGFRNEFLRDVRARIKEVTTRDYINPDDNTVDYVLLFIPNEQVYAFIHKEDSSILDEGIKNKVIFCSPITFFAVLAVIRQAVENFTLEKTSQEILRLLGQFHRQWQDFVGKMSLVGQRITEAQEEYERLVTTRRRKLEVPLRKIEQLRSQRGIAAEESSNETHDIGIGGK
ncbi:MAG: DNA recombination protein RmuC [Candidatus Omnitrophota bacterium]